ncbi:MAG: tRNA uridine-5-carboxymethylaminomethyl(34) synthesis enzyme MnmG [Salibacteraceae bacterium]
MMFEKSYDIIVIGGGHAGCEAAAAAANLGSQTLLITMDMTKFAQMSCNPAMGGVAKGQIIREIDALGGYSGIVSDYSAIQFRMLNRSKGPAMWSPRTQNDRTLFTIKWRQILENLPNLHFWQDSVTGLLISNDRVTGVRTSLGIEIKAKAVILTAGTFMNGVIHVGPQKVGGGRMGEKPATGITEQLKSHGLETGRMKTGTPPRVDGRSLDYSKMEEQKGDVETLPFSFLEHYKITRQRSCHITYTNTFVHETLHQHISESPLYNGQIQSIGPRYCPSIEDKIVRFSDKDRHQVFVEPEGWNTHEVYVNGFSTSMPFHVQQAAIKLIPGFENAILFRPGYAIEYDYFAPNQLHPSLESKAIQSLFLAGQVNGTTGYEEAAAQGIMAGINAHRTVNHQPPFVLSRSDAYIGVMIDDLITKGTDEPYRMFTSRAEFRITLRQDTADERLTPLSYNIGLAGEERMRKLDKKTRNKQSLYSYLKKLSVSPNELNNIISNPQQALPNQSVKAISLLTRPDISIHDLISGIPDLSEHVSRESIRTVEIQAVENEIKYAGYIKREAEQAERLKKVDQVKISPEFPYDKLNSLSIEARQKLAKHKPSNLGEASRIPGIKPSDISVLMVSLQQNVSHET